MEKSLIVLTAMLMVLSFSVVGFADNQDSLGTMGPDQAKMDQKICGPGEIYTGEVVWVHPSIHRIMVSGVDGSEIFDVSGATVQGTPETDRLVTVKYSETNGEKLASSVEVIPQRLAFVYERFY